MWMRFTCFLQKYFEIIFKFQRISAHEENGQFKQINLVIVSVFSTFAQTYIEPLSAFATW